MKSNKLIKLVATITISAGAAFTVTSCADGSSLRTGPVLAPTQAASVKVLTEKPKRSYTTLGLVESEMDKGLFTSKSYTAKKALEELKEQSAKLGANAVIIKDYTSTTSSTAILDANDDIGLPLNLQTKRITGTAIFLK